MNKDLQRPAEICTLTNWYTKTNVWVYAMKRLNPCTQRVLSWDYDKFLSSRCIHPDADAQYCLSTFIGRSILYQWLDLCPIIFWPSWILFNIQSENATHKFRLLRIPADSLGFNNASNNIEVIVTQLPDLYSEILKRHLAVVPITMTWFEITPECLNYMSITFSDWKAWFLGCLDFRRSLLWRICCINTLFK